MLRELVTQLKYLFQDKISKAVLIFVQLADFVSTTELTRCIKVTFIFK